MNSLSTRKILLVDDNPSILEMVKEELCLHAGILPENISLASSGNSARALIIRSGDVFDLIVSDFNMPDGSGKELLEFLIQQNSNAYFILFTATLHIQIPTAWPNFLGVIEKHLLGTLTSIILKEFH